MARRRPARHLRGEGPLALGAGLGPFLWQLPPSLRFDAARVEAFLAALPRTTGEVGHLAEGHDEHVPPARALTTPLVEQPVRHALEPRHESWGEPAAAALLAAYDVSMVVSDLDNSAAGRAPHDAVALQGRL